MAGSEALEDLRPGMDWAVTRQHALVASTGRQEWRTFPALRVSTSCVYVSPDSLACSCILHQLQPYQMVVQQALQRAGTPSLFPRGYSRGSSKPLTRSPPHQIVACGRGGGGPWCCGRVSAQALCRCSVHDRSCTTVGAVCTTVLIHPKGAAKQARHAGRQGCDVATAGNAAAASSAWRPVRSLA